MTIPKSDIVITVEGGALTGIFGPKDMTYVLLDFDNLKQGQPEVFEQELDGTVDGKDCQEAFKEAENLMKI